MRSRDGSRGHDITFFHSNKFKIKDLKLALLRNNTVEPAKKEAKKKKSRNQKQEYIRE